MRIGHSPIVTEFVIFRKLYILFHDIFSLINVPDCLNNVF